MVKTQVSRTPSIQAPDEPVAGFIGLGSNVGEKTARLRSAIADIDRLPRTGVSGRSSLYRSLPMGVVNQPIFVNAVIRIETRLSAPDLLAELHKIERRYGRTRKLRWGPRTLDLDLLVYGDTILDQDRLKIPHPGIPLRSFVLHPLFEIAPHLAVPGMGTPESMLKACPGPEPHRLAP